MLEASEDNTGFAAGATGMMADVAAGFEASAGCTPKVKPEDVEGAKAVEDELGTTEPRKDSKPATDTVLLTIMDATTANTVIWHLHHADDMFRSQYIVMYAMIPKV